MGIFEPMIINKNIRQLIFKGTNQDELKSAALENNMVTLRQDALEKLFRGITSVKEVLKTTTEDF